GPDPAGTGAGSQVRPPGLRQRYLRSNCGISAIISADVSTIELKPDRKSTRLNSSHLVISYAVFCLKKKRMVSFRNTWPNRTCNGSGRDSTIAWWSSDYVRRISRGSWDTTTLILPIWSCVLQWRSCG